MLFDRRHPSIEASRSTPILHKVRQTINLIRPFKSNLVKYSSNVQWVCVFRKHNDEKDNNDHYNFSGDNGDDDENDGR